VTGDHLLAAVNISQQLAEARKQAAVGRAAQERALKLRAELAPEVWDAYHVEGKTSPQIAARLVGVSHDTVRRIVGSRAHPTPRPV
jgi:hypothetical protein